ncbi:hypothetical protein ACF0H5_006987 [Mactra antiquata]
MTSLYNSFSLQSDRYSGGEIYEVFSVASSTSENKTIDETRILNGSEYSNKTLIVESDNPIVLEVFSRNGGYVEGMLAIPVESMNRSEETPFEAFDYVVNTFCDTGGYCQLAVAALEDETVVSIEVPAHVDDVVFCKDRSYFHSKTSKVITLQKYDAFQIETTFDLTGTHIFSFKPISVFAGSRGIELNGVVAHTIEQLVPTWHWGTEFLVMTLGNNGYGDIVKITGSHANVTVTMSGFNSFKLNNHYQVISRRLERGMVSYIRATSPIQVMQISGLKYASNSTDETLELSMTFVPSVQNVASPTGQSTACETADIQVLYKDGGRSTVLFDPKATSAKPIRIDLSNYPSHILKLRIQFCGNAVMQFFSDSSDLSNSMVVRLSHNQIVASSCAGGNCMTKAFMDTGSFNNGGDVNCEVDMAYFWFWQNKTATQKPLCAGFGDEVNVVDDCNDENEFSFSDNSFTHVHVMGLFTDAKFNWEWRCMDRFSNCSVYGTVVCSEPMYESFVNKYCAKFCGKCTSDSYGRKFIVKVPTVLANTVDFCHILVSTVNTNTGVAAWSSIEGVVSVEKHDKYSRLYSCATELTQPHSYFKIISDDEVTVSVIYKTSQLFSYPVYPVDTFGLEYMILGNDMPASDVPTKICRFVSEYTDIKLLPHFTSTTPSVSEFENAKLMNLDMTVHLFQTVSGNSYSGTTFLFDKPVGVFCGTKYEVTDTFPDSNHVLPLQRWSTEYYVPAFDPLPPYLWIDAYLIIISNADNTLVNISEGFDAIYAIYNRGDVISVEIDIASSYRVTSRENIAVGLLLFDDDNSSMAFQLIPPASDMHDINVASLPNRIMTTLFGFTDVDTIATYLASGSANSKIEKEATEDEDFYRYVSLNQKQFGFSLISSTDGEWLVMPTPYKITSKTESVGQEICAISTDTTNDAIDGDCDRLVDEENCLDSGYGIYREDTDFDGGFGEDCKTKSGGESMVVKPTEPVCLIIDRPENQCWIPCKCKCSWVEKYEATKNMTEEELKDSLADETAEILNELQVDTVSLSSVAAQKKSKDDERPSAVSIGYVGIAIFCVVFGAIIFLDFGSIIRDARILMGNLNDGYERVFGC